MPKFCMTCRAANELTAEVCSKCGTEFPHHTEPQTEDATPLAVPPRGTSQPARGSGALSLPVTEERYPALQVISTIYGALGWLILVLGFLASAYVIWQGLGDDSELLLTGLLGIVVSGVVALIYLAWREVLLLAMSAERNTRRTYELLEFDLTSRLHSHPTGLAQPPPPAPASRASWTCPACGHSNAADAALCHVCGRSPQL
jgi:hypothetical protein